MLDVHLRWPVGLAPKAGGQALGPLPDAGDVDGFRRDPLLLGEAPLSSVGRSFLFFMPECATLAGIRGPVCELPQQTHTQSEADTPRAGSGCFWKFMQHRGLHIGPTHRQWDI